LIVLQHTTARKLPGALGYAERQNFLDPQKSGFDLMGPALSQLPHCRFSAWWLGVFKQMKSNEK
jgi:hypothetical protein